MPLPLQARRLIPTIRTSTRTTADPIRYRLTRHVSASSTSGSTSSPSSAPMPSTSPLPTPPTASPSRLLLPYDTQRICTRLASAGFTHAQCEAVLDALDESLAGSARRLDTHALPQVARDRLSTAHRKDCTSLRADVQLLERNDVALLRAETLKLAGDVEKLRQKLREDVARFEATTRLDANLERGRVYDEQRDLAGKLQATEARLEQETAEVRASLERIKFDTYRALFTTASTVGLIVLGYLRVFR